MGEENKKEKMTEEKANETRVLLYEDIRKYKLQRERLGVQIAQCDAMIAECELALADIDRQVAGVEYPEPPKEEKPVMGQPVGGKEDK